MMWPQLLPLIGGLLDKIIPDPKAAADAKLKVMELAQAGELAAMNAEVQLLTGQMDINKVEAASADPFTSRARPFIMWVCGIALLYASLIEPIGRFVAQVAFHYSGPFPAINTDVTLQVLLGLLGLSGMRSWEKVRGVTK